MSIIRCDVTLWPKLRLADVRYCDGFRMTVHRDGAACTAAVVRKPPRNEPAGEVRGGRSALSYGDLGGAEGVCDDRNALEGE